MPDDTIKDKDIKVGNKTIGFSSIVKLNVKTLLWLFGVLYIIMGYLYLDQRKELKSSSKILQSEKQEFFNGVQTTLSKDITDIKVGMETMKGDIKVIMDRTSRDNQIQPNYNTAVQPVTPPPITVTPSDTTQ